MGLLCPDICACTSQLQIKYIATPLERTVFISQTPPQEDGLSVPAGLPMALLHGPPTDGRGDG